MPAAVTKRLLCTRTAPSPVMRPPNVSLVGNRRRQGSHDPGNSRCPKKERGPHQMKGWERQETFPQQQGTKSIFTFCANALQHRHQKLGYFMPPAKVTASNPATFYICIMGPDIRLPFYGHQIRHKVETSPQSNIYCLWIIVG